jgi:Holliday junction DNA helicase RuvA
VYHHLEGLIAHKDPTSLVMAVGGIGFELRCSLHTSRHVKQGEKAFLYVHLHVTDGVPSLLGFTTQLERTLCRKLLSVAGVGPTIALAALSTDAPDKVAMAIGRGDAAALRRVKGIGPRTAERICLELRDIGQMLAQSAGGLAESLQDGSLEDAVAALMTLGFTPKEARARAEGARKKHPDSGADELTRQALRKAAG